MRYVKEKGIKYLEGGQNPIWQAIVSNSGNGPAIITGIRYCLRLKNGEEFELESGNKVNDEAESLGLNLREHFYLRPMSPGHAIRPGGIKYVLEMTKEAADKIDRLDVHYTHRSSVGATYQRSVYLVPRIKKILNGLVQTAPNDERKRPDSLIP